MIRLLVLFIIIAGVAGYFTRPDEAAMRTAAEAVLNDPGDIGELAEAVGAAVAGERLYNNYYVAAGYSVSINNEKVVQCYGAFTQVQCNRVEQAAS